MRPYPARAAVPSCIRAPPDSTKDTTGIPARSAMPSTRTIVSAWRSPSEPPRKRRPGHSRRSDARPRVPVAPTTPSPRTARSPRRDGAHPGAQHTQAARVAQRLQPLKRDPGARRPVTRRSRSRSSAAPRKARATLWPPNANELEMASGGWPLPVISGRASPGNVVEVELGIGRPRSPAWARSLR